MENQPSDSSRRRSGNETGAKAEQSIFAGKHFGVAAKAPADTKVSNAEEAWAEIQVARPYNPEAHPAPAPAPTTLVPVPPQSEPAAPESVPSNPIPIPGAQGAARLPTQFPGGLIAMDTSRAPVPAKDIELIKEGEANDLVYKERYCRLKQGHMKWAAEQTARGAPGRATTTVAEERVETSLAEEEEEEEEEGTKTEPEQEEPKAIIPLQGFRVGANAIMLGPDQTRAAEERIQALGGAMSDGPSAFYLHQRIPEGWFGPIDLVRRDGSVVSADEVLGSIRHMMGALDIRPAYGEEDPEDGKVEEWHQQRPLFALRQFLIDLQSVVQQIAEAEMDEAQEEEETPEEAEEEKEEDQEE